MSSSVPPHYAPFGGQSSSFAVASALRSTIGAPVPVPGMSWTSASPALPPLAASVPDKYKYLLQGATSSSQVRAILNIVELINSEVTHSITPAAGLTPQLVYPGFPGGQSCLAGVMGASTYHESGCTQDASLAGCVLRPQVCFDDLVRFQLGPLTAMMQHNEPSILPAEPVKW